MILYTIAYIAFKYAILPIAGFFGLKEVIGFLNLQRYSKQGVKTFYFPFVGFWKLFLPSFSVNNDILGNMKQERKDHVREDIIVWNDGLTTGSAVEIISPRAVREFFEKEIQVSIKKNIVNSDMAGFFFKNGEVVKSNRAAFSEIFHRDNLEIFCPHLLSVVYSHCAKLRKRWEQSGNEWLEVDIRKEVKQFLTFRFFIRCLTTCQSKSSSE